MNITIGKAELLSALDACRGAVERRTTLPILANYKLEATKHGLTVTATDLEIGMTAFVAASVDEEGAITVPAEKLRGYLKLLAEDDVTLKATPNQWLTVSQAKSKSRIAGMRADSFPVIPAAPADGDSWRFKAKTGELIASADAAMTSTSRQETRFTLNGGLLECDGSSIMLAATDGHRLIVSKVMDSDSGAAKCIVPNRALRMLRSLGDAVETEVIVGTDHIFFYTAERTLFSRRMTGNFPDYRRVLPSGESTKCIVQSRELADMLRRAMLQADDRSHAVELKFQENALTASSSLADSGDFEETIEIDGAVPEMTIKINASYVLDFLSLHTGDIEVRLFSNQTPMLMLAGNDQYVVMPMR